VKWVLRAAVAGIALALLALGVLAWALPRLARSEAARAKIEASARAALGRDVRYGEIGVGLLPPSLLVEEPAIAGETGDPPLARADRVALRVELWPLLHGQLEVASLAIDRPVLHLVRTKDGLALPRPESGQSPPSAPSDREAEPGASGGSAFEIRELAVRDGSLALEDRSVSPPQTWSVADIDVEAKSAGVGAPVAITGSLSDVKGGALAVAGSVALEAELDRLAAGAIGPFSIDARAARIAYGADFAKPSGTPAVVRGRIARGEGNALRIDDLVIELDNLVARGALRTAPSTELSLSADAFALEGWDALVPPLGMVKPSGRIGVPKLALSLDPLAVRGEIALDDLVATPPDMAPIELKGAVELLGNELHTRNLVARAAEQPIRVDARVTQLFDGPRFEVAFETKGADSNALLTGYAQQRDRLSGPLDMKGTLRGTTAGESSFLDALSGDLVFDIEQGRIVGVSLLEVVLGSFGGTVVEAVRQQGGKDWERFTSDRFESLRGTLQIADGRVMTSPVSLTYPDWGAQLEGPIRLSDLALDLKGRLTIKETLDKALARAFGARRDYVPQVRVVELASVRGEPGAPKVQLAGSGVANLAAAYAGSIERDELKKQLEKRLGPGSGELVDQGLEVLQGVLGGKKQ
jgi:uncharacterized protein involved in outer membrane biogenesis